MSAGGDVTIAEYLSLLGAHARPGQFFDIRWTASTGLGRKRSIKASDLAGAARFIIRVSRHTDVYVGVALRDRADYGGKAAVSGSRLLHVESDSAVTAEHLVGFPHPPTLEVSSGSPGHLHLYWQLDELASPQEVESANRRLARALAADVGSYDISRVLRPPSTLNHKHSPPRPVALLAYRERAIYTLDHLTSDLPTEDPPATPGDRALTRREAATPADLALLAIPAEVYVRVLAERSPNRAGKVLCPFHQERTPSLQLYPDGTFFCFGSSCRRVGTIYDFAAHLWGITPRGLGFIELRERLLEQFAP